MSDLAFLFVFPLHYTKKSLTKSVTHLESGSKEGRWIINPMKNCENGKKKNGFCFYISLFIYRYCNKNTFIWYSCGAKAIALLQTCMWDTRGGRKKMLVDDNGGIFTIHASLIYYLRYLSSKNSETEINVHWMTKTGPDLMWAYLYKLIYLIFIILLQNY